MNTPYLKIIVPLVGLITIGCGSDETSLLGSCDRKSDTFTAPNTDRAIEISTVSCALDPAYTTINYRENKDADPIEVFRAETGQSELTAEWYFLEHVIIKGKLENLKKVDLQTNVVNGVKVEYKLTEEKPVSED